MNWFRVKVFFVTTAVVSVIVTAAMAVVLFFTQARFMTTIEHDMISVCEIAEALVSNKIKLLKAELSLDAAALAGLTYPAASNLQKVLSDDDDFIALALYGEEGLLASCGSSVPGPDFLTGYSDGSRYAERALGGESFITTTRTAKDGRLVFFVCVPAGKGRFLVGSLPALLFSDIVSRFRLWNTGHISILDRFGTVIAHISSTVVQERHNYIEMAKTNPLHESAGNFFKVAMQGGKGAGRYDYYGASRVCAYMPLSESANGWTILAITPIAESPVRELMRDLVLVSAAFLVLGAFLSLLASGSIAKPFLQIDEQKRRLEELHEIARNASETKSHFLANMSHEMRTPLNAVIGLSELTLNEEDLGEAARTNLGKVYQSGVTLLNLINDILDISKIEAGRFEIIPVEYDISSLINDTATMNVIRVEDKPIVFEVDADENLFTNLIGDPLRLKQVFSNLLSNAFKYTKEGTVTWRVSAEREGETVWLTSRVTDTGVGIRSEDLEKLFSDYAQVDTKANRKVEGTGLGLSIVRQITELMGGTVSVESEYGKGSAFIARIPQTFVTDTRIGADAAAYLKKFEYSDVRGPRGSGLTRIRLPYAKVLVVDDVQTNLDVARGMLNPYGMRVDCVSDGPAAIRAVREEKVRYGAIFMDHMMPEMDGIEATRVIREEIGTEYARTVPIIALTANAITGNEEMFLSKGFQAFISKPIDVKYLDQMIRQWVRDKELEEEYLAQHPDVQDSSERRFRGDRRKLKDRRYAGAWEIDGLDIEKCFARFGNDEDSVLEVLRSYAANTPPLLDKMRAVTEGTLPDYAIIVHGIKGASRGICASSLGDRAEALEHAAKAGNFAFVSENNGPFVEAAEKLLSGLKEKLNGADAKNQKPKADAPDADTLARLRDACAAYDMDGVDAAMADLEARTYKSGQDLIRWLRTQVDMVDFERIHERLSQPENLG